MLYLHFPSDVARGACRSRQAAQGDSCCGSPGSPEKFAAVLLHDVIRFHHKPPENG
jgi:hypothetical protein